MSITLAQARTRVRFLVDDLASVVADDTQTDAALASAQQEAYQLAIGYGSSIFSQEVSWTSSASGVITLSDSSSPYIPSKVISLTLVDGQRRYQIPASRSGDVSAFASEALSGKMHYVPMISFPANSGASFLWGHSSINVPPLDEYMCALAASQIKVNEAEVNQALERRIERLQRTVERFVNPSQFSAFPIDDAAGGRRVSRFVWIRTSPTTIQLAYP